MEHEEAITNLGRAIKKQVEAMPADTMFEWYQDNRDVVTFLQENGVWFPPRIKSYKRKRPKFPIHTLKEYTGLKRDSSLSMRAWIAYFVGITDTRDLPKEIPVRTRQKIMEGCLQLRANDFKTCRKVEHDWFKSWLRLNHKHFRKRSDNLLKMGRVDLYYEWVGIPAFSVKGTKYVYFSKEFLCNAVGISRTSKELVDSLIDRMGFKPEKGNHEHFISVWYSDFRIKTKLFVAKNPKKVFDLEECEYLGKFNPAYKYRKVKYEKGLLKALVKNLSKYQKMSVSEH